MAQRNVSWHVVLFERHGHLGTAGTALGNEAEEQIGLPLAAAAIVPSHTHGEGAHVAGILTEDFGGYERSPMLAVAVQPSVVSAHAGRLLGVDGILLGVIGRGGGCRQKEHQQGKD